MVIDENNEAENEDKEADDYQRKFVSEDEED